MKHIRYSHLIVVPARDATVNPEMMTRLAGQMLFLKGKSLGVIAMPEGNEPAVIKTAEHLNTALTNAGFSTSPETRPITQVPISPSGASDKDQPIRAIIDVMLNPKPDCDVIVTVIELEYAQKIPGIFLWNNLECRHIIQGIDQIFFPGQAGVVDCQERNRYTLHPEGYENWVLSLYAGKQL